MNAPNTVKGDLWMNPMYIVIKQQIISETIRQA